MTGSIVERDGDWSIAYCPELPGTNGQGRTGDEARENLAAAITLILDDRREDALRGLAKDAEQGTVKAEARIPAMRRYQYEWKAPLRQLTLAPLSRRLAVDGAFRIMRELSDTSSYRGAGLSARLDF